MPSNFSQDHKRHWRIVALATAVGVHVVVVGGLLLQPTPNAHPSRPRIALTEWAYSFETPPPPPPPPAQQAVATAQTAPAQPTRTPTLRRRRDPIPAEQPTEYEAPAIALPEPHAGDLLRQIPGIARQNLPPAEQGRTLDLGLRAAPNSAAVRPERTQAGLGGAPTRGDAAPVGDLANGMLIEQWQGLHHDGGSSDCSRQQPQETLAMYIARCKS